MTLFLVRYSMKWVDKGRNGHLREYEYSEEHNLLKVICHRVLYCSYTQKVGSEKIIAVDPDGGPHFRIGRTIYNGDNLFMIRDIVSEINNHKSKKLTIVLDVTRV